MSALIESLDEVQTFDLTSQYATASAAGHLATNFVIGLKKGTVQNATNAGIGQRFYGVAETGKPTIAINYDGDAPPSGSYSVTFSGLTAGDLVFLRDPSSITAAVDVITVPPSATSITVAIDGPRYVSTSSLTNPTSLNEVFHDPTTDGLSLNLSAIGS